MVTNAPNLCPFAFIEDDHFLAPEDAGRIGERRYGSAVGARRFWPRVRRPKRRLLLLLLALWRGIAQLKVVNGVVSYVLRCSAHRWPPVVLRVRRLVYRHRAWLLTQLQRLLVLNPVSFKSAALRLQSAQRHLPGSAYSRSGAPIRAIIAGLPTKHMSASESPISLAIQLADNPQGLSSAFCRACSPRLTNLCCPSKIVRPSQGSLGNRVRHWAVSHCLNASQSAGNVFRE